jgi:hypothetical protein
MQHIGDAGVALIEYAGESFRGVLTGLNEAFFIDTPTRDRLVMADPKSAELIKPLLRGQDIDRWASEWSNLWLIFTRHGTDIDSYPALKAHLTPFRDRLEPKPADWRGAEWPGRKPEPYRWWEIQDNVAFYERFSLPKIIYQEIQYYPAYSIDWNGHYLTNKGFMLTTDDPWLLAVLNSPLLWWVGWRHFPHMKDEALTPVGFRMDSLPIAKPLPANSERVAEICGVLVSVARDRQAAQRMMRNWLTTTWELTRAPNSLLDPFALSADAFSLTLRRVLPPRRQNFSAAAIAVIHAEHAATIAPVAARLAQAAELEKELSALVNQAYGLTAEDEQLMWATAPPRMPIPPPAKPSDTAVPTAAPMAQATHGSL